MKILGLHVHGAQSAAALVVDGEVRHAVAEERFNRIKNSRAFPQRSIQYCLDQAGLSSIENLDAIAISWNPVETMRTINLSGFTGWRRYDPEWLYIVPNHLLSMAGGNVLQGEFASLLLDGKGRVPIQFINHHMAHAAHAAFQSPFDSGAVAVLDEYGETVSATLGRFKGNKIETLKSIPYPHSLGVFYAAVTEFIGFSPNGDEWKVMGAAALGSPQRFQGPLERVLIWNDDTRDWTLDQRYVEHANMKRGGYCNESFERLMGVPRRNYADPITQVHYDIAAAAQAVFEKRLFQILNHLADMTGEGCLAASGGCFMNSMANGRILANTPFRRLFIPYAAADNGAAMGAALFAAHQSTAYKAHETAPSPYLGPSFSEDRIRIDLEKCKIPYETVSDPAQTAARLIHDGKIIGWFQGHMEFGERALGGRSILADPRDATVKDRINAAVKYREAFRPFAPSVLEEQAHLYFSLPSGASAPYMEQVYPVRSEWQSRLPAITHADGTARLQSVSRQTNPLYYRLLEEFAQLSGIPIVVNTSFNIKDEPIVCSPIDAIRTFFSCGLDALVIGGNLVRK